MQVLEVEACLVDLLENGINKIKLYVNIFYWKLIFSRLLYNCHVIRMMWQWKSTINFSFYKAIIDLNANFYCHVFLVVWWSYSTSTPTN
jgi:hypothetical protein